MTDITPENKLLATLAAAAALNGIQVHHLSDGTFLVSRWQFARAVPDLRALRLFLAQQGVVA